LTLKDVINHDREDVFMNTDEIAEYANIDGKQVKIVADTYALNDKSDVYALGISEGERLIFIKEEDISREPLIGDQLTINGKEWYVRHSIFDTGIYELRIGRERIGV